MTSWRRFVKATRRRMGGSGGGTSPDPSAAILNSNGTRRNPASGSSTLPARATSLPTRPTAHAVTIEERDVAVRALPSDTILTTHPTSQQSSRNYANQMPSENANATEDDDDEPLAPVVLARSLSAGSHELSAFSPHLTDAMPELPTSSLPCRSVPDISHSPTAALVAQGTASNTENSHQLAEADNSQPSEPTSQVEAFRHHFPHLNSDHHSKPNNNNNKNNNVPKNSNRLPEPKQKRPHKRHHPQHLTARELNFDPVLSPSHVAGIQQHLPTQHDLASPDPADMHPGNDSQNLPLNPQKTQPCSSQSPPPHCNTDSSVASPDISTPPPNETEHFVDRAEHNGSSLPEGHVPDHLPAPKVPPATPIVVSGQTIRPARAIVAAHANSAGLGRKSSHTSHAKKEKPRHSEVELFRRLSLDGNMPEEAVRPDADDQSSEADEMASSFNVEDDSMHVKVRAPTSVLTDVSGCSKAGWEPSRAAPLAGQPVEVRKENQDAYCVFAPFATSSDQIFLGVFDGHGAEGRAIAHFVRDEVPRLVQHVARSSSAINSRAAPSGTGSDVHKAIMHALKSAFSRAERGLTESDSQIDHVFSGTTAVVAWFFSNHVYTAWAGDSRAVVGRVVGSASCTSSSPSSAAPVSATEQRRPQHQQHLRVPADGSEGAGKPNNPARFIAVELTYDQKPVRPDEKKRVKAAGGRIARWRRNVGPLRVWLPKDWIPGLAMTRSIGDTVLSEFGVSPIPEVSYAKLTSADSFIVLASDGVWEFMSSQEVVDFVGRLRREGKTADGAAESLVREAVRRWRRNEIVVDDTTAVVMWMDCSVSSDVTEISSGHATSAGGESAPGANSTSSAGRKAFRLALGRGGPISSSSSEASGIVSIIREDGRLGHFVCKNDVQA